MNKEKIKVEPMIIIREILPGDRVTLQFQKGGYLYFQAIDIEQLWTQKEVTK